MMKINFRQDFYLNNEATLLRKENNPHDIPDNWLAILPTTATFADGPNQGKTVEQVRDPEGYAKRLGLSVEPPPVVDPLPNKAASTATGGIDAPVMEGVKDTLSPPPNAPGGNRPANPPALTMAVDNVDELGHNAGPNPGKPTKNESSKIEKK